MITLRRSAERGHADRGWLDSFHSFSFADYHDPEHMGFGNLRVINEDRVAPGSGFGTHGHRDMEIISYVLDGALGHEDSIGNGAVIQPGDVQRMSAGSGIRHSEFNHAADKTTHFLQIWIEPTVLGIAPGYEQKSVSAGRKRGVLARVAAPASHAEANEGVVTLNADASMYVGLINGAERAELALDPRRLAYVHVARGALSVNDRPLQAGDAAKLDGESRLVLAHGQDAEVIVFDLAR